MHNSSNLEYGLWWNFDEDRIMFSMFPQPYHIKAIAEKFNFHYQDLCDTLINSFGALVRHKDGCLYWIDDDKAYEALKLIEGMVVANRLLGKKAGR
jgi:hypothetical protein